MNNIDKVYEVLTRKSYNREDPFLPQELRKCFQYYLSHDQPIRLIGFWGVGPKNKPNWADIETCDFFVKLDAAVRKVYAPGIEFTFIFATLHGVHNGIDKGKIVSYVSEMEVLFKERRFRFLYLDRLWKKYDISFEKIDVIFEKKPAGWWDKVESAEKIERNAKNRNIRLDPVTAAQKYVIMRTLEKEMLEKEYAGYVFHAFSDSTLKCVLPNMPTLYLFARKGWSNAPWFVIKEP